MNRRCLRLKEEKLSFRQRMKKQLKRFDWLIFLPYLALSLLGVVMVYSASAYRLMMQEGSMISAGLKQFFFLIISLCVMMVIYFMKPKILHNRRLIMGGYSISLVLLVAVLLFGKSVNGAKGWLNIFGIQFQPLELFKLGMIFLLAYILTYGEKWDFAHRFLLYFSIGVGLCLIVVQPDTGGFVMCLLLLMAIGLCSGRPVLHILALIGLIVLSGLLIGGLLILLDTSGYRSQRLLSAWNPFSDTQGSGHQIVNSYYALNNGGWFGVGLGKSIEKLGFLPEAQTDFIFSIIVEELGMVTGLLVVCALTLIIIRTFYIAYTSKSRFHKLVCIGIGTLIFLQMFINLGGLLSIIPLTGVTLPFLSQGGTSLVILSISIAIILKISAAEYDYRRHQPKRKLKVIE